MKKTAPSPPPSKNEGGKAQFFHKVPFSIIERKDPIHFHQKTAYKK